MRIIDVYHNIKYIKRCLFLDNDKSENNHISSMFKDNIKSTFVPSEIVVKIDTMIDYNSRNTSLFLNIGDTFVI